MLKSWILLLFVLVTVCDSRNTITTTKNIIPSPRIVILVRYFFVQLSPLMSSMYQCGWVMASKQSINKLCQTNQLFTIFLTEYWENLSNLNDNDSFWYIYLLHLFDQFVFSLTIFRVVSVLENLAWPMFSLDVTRITRAMGLGTAASWFDLWITG